MKQFKLLLVLCSLALSFPAQQQEKAQSVVSINLLGNGGDVLNSGKYKVVATIGQPIIGVAPNAPHINSLGFWYLSNHNLLIEGEKKPSSEPTSFILMQNYPNPFNPETEIRFALPKASYVVLKIYNTVGQEVRTLLDEEYQPGSYSTRWDGRDSNGSIVPSGMYFFHLRAGEFVQTRKMILMK